VRGGEVEKVLMLFGVSVSLIMRRLRRRTREGRRGGFKGRVH
jgi:hypothetical protein